MGNSQSCRGSRSIPGRGDSCTMAWPSGNEFKADGSSLEHGGEAGSKQVGNGGLKGLDVAMKSVEEEEESQEAEVSGGHAYGG